MNKSNENVTGKPLTHIMYFTQNVLVFFNGYELLVLFIISHINRVLMVSGRRMQPSPPWGIGKLENGILCERAYCKRQ